MKRGIFFLRSAGSSSNGDKPFLDKYCIKSKSRIRLWSASTNMYQLPSNFIGSDKILVRRESRSNAPHYAIINLRSNISCQLVSNPSNSSPHIQVDQLRYKRKDGLDLMGSLYLPPWYDSEKHGKIPVILWAYPRTFSHRRIANQTSYISNQYVRFPNGSPIYWVYRGYAVFLNFDVPIVAAKGISANDTFIEQLLSSTEAAVEALKDHTAADTNKLVIAGHSYGAFMAVNLLAHSDFFVAGIARSGAYNRTLTPLGFQSETRTLWEVPDVYIKMSPIMYADRISAPLLLVHGGSDANTSTSLIQSEMLYSTLVHHNVTTRLVILPQEGHTYKTREANLHVIWEMDRWLDKYVKGKPK